MMGRVRKKLKDSDEKFRRFVNLQYIKIKKVAAVGSMVLLAINLSLTIFLYMEERDIHPYVGIPVIFTIVMFILWGLAHIYVKKMEMYRTEQMAEVTYNPYAVYAFAPFQEMIYSHYAVPMQKALLRLLPKDSEEYKELKELSEKFEGWCKSGFIPKEDFPPDLRRYYLTEREGRL
jgi:hypothetical protein